VNHKFNHVTFYINNNPPIHSVISS